MFLRNALALACIFLASFSYAGPSIAWSARRHITTVEWGQFVLPSKSGDIFVVGTRGRSDQRAVVMRYSKAGALMWTRINAGGTSTYAEVNDAQMDAAGNIWIVGRNLGVGLHRYQSLILKYSQAGALLLTRVFNYSSAYGDDSFQTVRFDSFGNVYVSGESDIGNTSGRVAVYRKYSPQGGLLWSRTLGGANDTYCYGLALSRTGIPYAMARISGRVGVHRFDAKSGTGVWSREWYASGYSYWLEGIPGHFPVAFDSAGDLVVAVSRKPASSDYRSHSVRKVSWATGNQLWSSSLPQTYQGSRAAITQGDLGDTYYVVAEEGDPSALHVSLFQANGNRAWTKSFNGSTSWAEFSGIAALKGGSIAVLATYSWSDSRLYRLTRSGALTWMFPVKVPNSAFLPIGLAVFGLDQAAITGQYRPSLSSGLQDFQTFSLRGL